MDWKALFAIVSVVVVGLTMTFGLILPAKSEGNAAVKALESISRTPDAANQISRTLFVSLALIESLAIYILVVCLILLFANPLASLIK
jgi:F-type H+-transporting ATPase subunit c